MTHEQEIESSRHDGMLKYIVAVVVMSSVGVAGIVGVTIIRPGDDNGIIITYIVGLLIPSTTSLLAFIKSRQTNLSVNSRLDEFIRNASRLSHAEGVTEGQRQQRIEQVVLDKERNERI